MQEFLYDRSSVHITAVLFVVIAVAVEAGFRAGLRAKRVADESMRTYVNTIQAALLGVLALLLAFSLSLALERHDSRSQAVVDEANAIGTAWLRTELLPESIQPQVRLALREYLDLRIEASRATVLEMSEVERQRRETASRQNALWSLGTRSVALDDRPATTGLFLQSLNEMIDSYGRRTASVDRHVPEVVLLLLCGTFVLVAAIVGYAGGLSGQRSVIATYIMVTLITVLVFLVIDLDRPRRGLIAVDHTSLIVLQRSIGQR